MDLERINQFNQAKLEAQDKQVLLNTITSAGDKVAEAVNKSDNKTVTVTNDLAKPSDIDKVVEAVKAIDLKPQDLQPIADALSQVSQAIAKLPTEYPEFPELPEAPEQREDVKVTNLVELKEYFQDVVTAVGKLQTSIKFDPKIEVKPADVKVTEQKIDLTPVTKGLANLEKAFKNIKTPNFDTTDIIAGLESVYNSINGLSFPVPNYVLPFKGANGEATQVQLDASGNLPISASISGADGAITDGVSSSIKATVKDLTNSNPVATQIMDANGDAITSFGGGTQYTEADVDASFTGTMSLVEGAGNTAVTLNQPTQPTDTQPISAASLPLPTGAATSAKQDDIITAIGGIGGGGTQYSDGDANADPTGTVAMGTDGSNVFAIHTDTAGDLQIDVLSMPTTAVTGTFWQATQPVSAASLPLPSGAATAANQQTDALTDTQLRATPVPVSGTVTANTGLTQPLTDTQLRATPVPVSGTFYQATQPVSGTVTANLAAGTNNIGDVDVLSLPALPAGTNAIGKLAANSGVDIGDVTLNNTLGAGTSDASTIRTTESTGATSVLANVSGSASSVTLVASNTDRRKVVMYNDSTADCYVKYGSAATSTSFTWLMAAGSHIEEMHYNGIITGIWTSATGSMRITEVD